MTSNWPPRPSLICRIILNTIQADSVVNTDEYAIYARLPAWGYTHVTVDHGDWEWAHDGDGIDKVHIHTIEDERSKLRS